jgi:hypothetical protein
MATQKINDHSYRVKLAQTAKLSIAVSLKQCNFQGEYMLRLFSDHDLDTPLTTAYGQ